MKVLPFTQSVISLLTTSLVVILFLSTSCAIDVKGGPKKTHFSQKTEMPQTPQRISASSNSQLRYVEGKRWIKTTAQDCEIRGGEFRDHGNILPQDMVDCSLPSQIKSLGGKTYLLPRQILGSVYDYLYRSGTENPNYGLYSYVLIPIASRRAENLLKELFATSSFVELTGIKYGNLNIIYLPTQQEKLSSLIPMVSDGSAPPLRYFLQEYYDYSLARELLANICTAPADVIREICATDLSRGPYLFTYSHPASAVSPVPPPYLFLDLSSVHERAFGEFVSAYKEQVKRTDYTDQERIDNLRLRMLTIVLTAADWVEPIKGALANIVYIAKGTNTESTVNQDKK